MQPWEHAPMHVGIMPHHYNDNARLVALVAAQCMWWVWCGGGVVELTWCVVRGVHPLCLTLP